jgi:hypothetical protein
MFTVRGKRLGRPVTITWGAGQLEGDAAVELAVGALVADREQVGMVPVGPWARAALSPAWVAHLTVLAVLDAGAETTTDDEAALWPPNAGVPDGAVV